jgi:hypothetical protein
VNFDIGIGVKNSEHPNFLNGELIKLRIETPQMEQGMD